MDSKERRSYRRGSSSEEKVKDNPEASGLNKSLDRALLTESRKTEREDLCWALVFLWCCSESTIQ